MSIPPVMTELERFIVELTSAAAEVTLPFFRSDIGHVDKGGAAGFDPPLPPIAGDGFAIALQQ